MSERKPGKIEKGLTDSIRALSKGKYLNTRTAQGARVFRELGVNTEDKPGTGEVSKRAAQRKRTLVTSATMDAGPFAPEAYPQPNYKNIEKLAKTLNKRTKRSGK